MSPAPGVLRVAIDVDEGEIWKREKKAKKVSTSIRCRIEKKNSTSTSTSIKKISFFKKTVLGRFLHKLNGFCKDEYGLDVDISDYHVYEFAKVR